MSIAEKFEVIADAVYAKGKQAEYDKFWDSYQDYGNSKNYISSFAGRNWKDENFKPKYPIITEAMPNRTNSTFYYTGITEIMIPLYFYDTTANSTFYGALITRIGDDTGGGIWVTRDRHFTSNFGSCTKLTEIRFIDYNEKGEYVPSEIGNSIDFKNCSLLSVASMKNIIRHLVDYSVDSPGTYTLTLHADAWTRLEASGTPKDDGIDFDGTWRNYVSSLGWNT